MRKLQCSGLREPTLSNDAVGKRQATLSALVVVFLMEK
jgi:hypothetical protein